MQEQQKKADAKGSEHFNLRTVILAFPVTAPFPITTLPITVVTRRYHSLSIGEPGQLREYVDTNKIAVAAKHTK
jgi:hypothetical protein